MNVGEGMEVFYIWLDYQQLDLSSGKSEAKKFPCETMALDAPAALAHALKTFQATQPAGVKVWGVVATVEIAGDVLRDELEATLPGPATMFRARRLAELAFDYANAETVRYQDLANIEAENLAINPEQYEQWQKVVDLLARGELKSISEAQTWLSQAGRA